MYQPCLTCFTAAPKKINGRPITIEIRIQTRQDHRRHTIKFQYLVRVTIMVELRLPWLALGASHKPNLAKDSVPSFAVLTVCNNNYGLT